MNTHTSSLRRLRKLTRSVTALAAITLSSLAAAYPTPTVKRPPIFGSPFVGGTSINLKDVGYEEKEFFFSGYANAYSTDKPLTSDGKWSVRPTDISSYKSRMLVYRPQDPAKFNGTVLVEWLNVTAGVDAASEWVNMHTEMLRRGYIWVGISAQYVGVEGGPTALPSPLGRSLPLKDIGPLRYRSLSHPGDSFSYDIFGQAAQAIRAPRGLAPLGDMKAERVIAIGESQSATRLVTFINAFANRTNVFDGYFLHSRLGYVPEFGGGSARLAEAPLDEINAPRVVLLRDDLNKPVMEVQTESDLFITNGIENTQPDNDHLRIWEIAGASHADYYITNTGRTDVGDDVAAAQVFETTEAGFPLPECPDPINSAPQHHYAAEAALNTLNDWISSGSAPESKPRLKLTSDGSAIARDVLGNALGGVRSSYVDVPTATMSGENSSEKNPEDICFLLGSTYLLDGATLAELYPNKSAYMSAVLSAVTQQVNDGTLLVEDAEMVIKAADLQELP